MDEPEQKPDEPLDELEKKLGKAIKGLDDVNRETKKFLDDYLKKDDQEESSPPEKEKESDNAGSQ